MRIYFVTVATLLDLVQAKCHGRQPNYYYYFFCPEVLCSPRDLDIINLVGVLSGRSGLVVHRRGEGTGEGHKIVSLDCY